MFSTTRPNGILLIAFAVFFIYVSTSEAAPIQNTPQRSSHGQELYSTIPNEILPIQPVLVYPKKSRTYQGRNLLKDNDIIYVKLLERKNYRPKKYRKHIEANTRELQANDIFYVKAKVNGQFSTNRLKVYRLPEFYAINIYKMAAAAAAEDVVQKKLD